MDQFNNFESKKTKNKKSEEEKTLEVFSEQLRASSLQYSGLTITSGLNLNDGQPYYFYGAFYDDGNYEASFISAYLESKLIGDDDRTLNDSMYLTGNYKDASIDNVSYTNGSTEKTGDLDSQDSDEYWFESSQVYRYPGTYSFEGEVGRIGTDISMVDVVSTAANTRVSEIVDKHRDILNQTNTGSNDYCYNNFDTNIKNGVVEYWIRTADSTQKTDLRLRRSTTTIVEFYIQSGYFKYTDSSGGAQTIQTCSSNTWYHVRIVWRDSSKFDVYINGIKKVSNVVTRSLLSTGINQFYFRVYATTSYLDAWGQSWNTDYVLGTNYYWQYYTGSETVENYNQSITNGFYHGAPYCFNDESVGATSPSWVNSKSNCTTIINDYLLNHYKYLNVTGAGSYRQVENVPSNSSFVFLNGTKVSDGHLWTINNDYTTLQSTIGSPTGTYPANYTFTTDADGADPAGWTVGEPAGCTVQVIASVGNHTKNVELYDNNGANVADCHDHFNDATSGTIEFWWRTSDATKLNYMNVKHDGSAESVYLIIYADKFQYHDGSFHDVGLAALDNTWYHMRVDFECGAGAYKGLFPDGWHLYINSVHYGDYSLRTVQAHLDTIVFQTSADTGFYSYLDAIDYSWTTGYLEGRNKVALCTDAVLNFTSVIQKNSIYTNETFDYVKLYYSHKTNQSSTINFYVWNFITSTWYLVNSSNNYAVFANNYVYLSSNYYNSTGHIRLRFLGNNGTSTFRLYIDRLSVVTSYSFGNRTTYCYVKSNYAYSSSDTIEFWWQTNATNRFIQFGIGNSTNWIIKITNNETSTLYYHNGMNWVSTGFTYSINTWYHIKISWTNSLITDRFSLWINGYLYINNKLCFSNISNIQYFKLNLYLCQVYLDGFGIVSDSGYLEGQNKNPYEEDLLDTDFNDDWTQTYNLNTYVKIYGEFGKHRNLITLVDNNATSYASARYSFSNKVSGKVEFWFKSPSVAGQNASIHVGYGSSIYQVYIIFDSNMKIKYYDGTWQDICNYWANTWYHIRIDFDCGTDKYSFYLNQTLKVSNVNFLIPMDYLSSVIIRTCYKATNFNVSVSTISFDWEYSMYTIYNTNIYVELNFTSSFIFTDFDCDILHLKIWRYQYTTVSIGITFYIFNWTSGLWLNVSKTQNTSGQTYIYMTNTTITNLVYNNAILFRFYGAKYYDDEYTLKMDRLQVRIYQKTTVYLTKAYYERGVWKYRFHLISSTFVSSYTDWVYFDVVENEPNVELISESDFVTKWNFINSIGTQSTIYENSSSDFTSWNIGSISSVWGVYSGTSHDVSTQDIFPSGIFWDGTYWYVSGITNRRVYKYTSSWTYTGVSYDVSAQDTSPRNVFWDGTNWWMLGSGSNRIYKYTSSWTYTGVSYDVSAQDTFPRGIFWDGTNWWMVGTTNQRVYKYTSSWTYTGVSYYVGSQDGTPMSIFWDGTNWWMAGYQYDRIYKYTSSWTYTGVSYYVGSQDGTLRGIFWDGTNWWMLGSGSKKVFKYDPYWNTINQNVSLDIEENTNIQITFNTTVTNSINLNLLNDGSVVESYEILKNGNGNFLTQQATITVDSDLGTIDQLQMESTQYTTEHFYLEYLEIIEYNASISTFYVNPQGINKIFVPYTYNYEVQIYENNILKEALNLTSSQTIQTLIYERTTTVDCYINFYDINNDYLNFFEFKTYINYTFEELNYINVRMTDNVIRSDSNTFIYFLIYDSFDILVKTYSTSAYSFIDVSLTIYSLKIKNEYDKSVEYNITKGTTTKTGLLFSQEIVEYLIYSGTYNLSYLKSDKVNCEIITFELDSNKLLVINSSKICFISYANQRGDFLDFNNYKTYLDGVLLYQNIFYRDIGSVISIETKDRYDISIKNSSYTVLSTDNYIPIALIEYSLKVYNQQPYFNHINITRDPNYYESLNFWSEWLAPSEIISFKLFAGYYKINFTRAESGDSYAYAYTLNGDDILLISSSNTIYNVLQNIANVNTTIGNQITNVWIDISNQNSNLNNSIVNIDINLSNINSTIGNMLLYQNITLNNVHSDLNALYLFTESNFINLGNNINVSFISIENNIYSINETISLLVLNMENSLSLINGTISTMIASIGQDIMLMNMNIMTSLFYMNTTLDLIGNNITDLKLAIINDILMMNNTIMNGINQIYSSVFLVNNSIYTAVVEVGSSLSIINNTISGNISILLQQNDFLTELYKRTMFSQLLNWSGVGYNTSFIENQIVAKSFVNKYKDKTLEIQLKYQNITETLRLTAQTSKNIYIPITNVSFRVYSVDDGVYLTEWEPLSEEDETIDFGFYQEEISSTPVFEDEEAKIDTVWLDVLIILVMLGAIIGGLLIYLFRNKIKDYGQNLTKKDNNNSDLKKEKNKKRDEKYYERKLYKY